MQNLTGRQLQRGHAGEICTQQTKHIALQQPWLAPLTSTPQQQIANPLPLSKGCTRCVCGASPHVTAHGYTGSLSLKRCTLQATKAIPAGKVSTYGALADVLNSAPQAVGQVSLQLAASVMLLLASCA